MRVRHLWLIPLLALLVGACGGGDDDSDRSSDTSVEGTLLFGGDVFLARNTNLAADLRGYEYPFADLGQLFAGADATLLNLESVVSSRGRPVGPKGERSPYYFRGRPDLVRILTEAGVDMVNGANNHSFDYGPDALTEQMAILDAAGIRYTGIGKNADEARRYRRLAVGDLVVAVIGVDSTQRDFAAGSTTPGIHYLSEDEPDQYVEHIREQVELARREADLVMLTVHWGVNEKERPTETRRALARRLIREAGLDAILGHSAHLLQGMELVDGKPVLYDAGNLLVDGDASDWIHRSVLFGLKLTPGGVSEIELHPIRLRFARTERADEATAAAILDRFRQLSEELSDELDLEGNRVRLPDPPDREPGGHTLAPAVASGALPRRQDVDPTVRVTKLPDDLIPVNHTFANGITLLGVRPLTDSVRLTYGFFVTSYWTSEKTPERSELINVKLRPVDRLGPIWDGDTIRSHHPGDWSYPTDLWRPGEVVEDHYFVRGFDHSALKPYRVYLGMGDEEVPVGQITVVSRY